MPDELPYQRILQESLRSELRVLNAHLPCQQKPLLDVLHKEYPSVICNDGSTHLFKKAELEYLASIVNSDEQGGLLLPILIEIIPGCSNIAIICRGDVEEKVISRILKIPVVCEQNKIMIYKTHLSLIRKLLKTTTQYLFNPK
jgi:uncharacterized protein (UPF0216 family)